MYECRKLKGNNVIGKDGNEKLIRKNGDKSRHACDPKSALEKGLSLSL